ncbi:MAG: hypothetical protein NTY99_03295 [DPANN group archaeon]|nr:hypothetical protein [DPANN group archaeon]
MLYELTMTDVNHSNLEPCSFLDFSELGKVEKDLEVLIAEHLLDVLFEDAILMPIYQERQLQAEADIYAINKNGDLTIFELKRGTAGADAMLQALRYSQSAGLWSYQKLQDKYFKYAKTRNLTQGISLADAHKEAFSLDMPLSPEMFNRRQHLIVVGNAANNELIDAVDYWKHTGLNVDFLPYRLYRINSQLYFEFFALPYDRHQNPASIKGVLFDTNRSYNEESIWDMMEKSRVSAYGDTSYVIDYLRPKDIVFFSHKCVGLVAAAEVTGPRKQDNENDEWYRDVRFLTPVPKREEGLKKVMSFGQVSEVTNKSFFWARTIKVPYLTKNESEILLEALKSIMK